MNKIAWGVVGLMVLVAFIPTMTARAERNDLLKPGVDYNISTTAAGYIRVNASDILTFNQKSDIPSGKALGIYIYTTTLALDWINFSEGSGISGYGAGYAVTLTNSAPYTCWIKVTTNDILYFYFNNPWGLTDIKYNFTIISANDAININNLTSQISTLNDIIYNMTTNISKIMSQISDIYTDIYNLSAWEAGDIGNVRAEITEISNSLHQMIENLDYNSSHNDSALTKNIDTVVINLNQLVEGLNDSLNTKISEIPIYNDTSVWSELDNLSKVQPVVEINNTTVHNETLLTLVNQTIVNQTLINETPVTHTYTNKTISLNGDSGNAVGAAIVAGVVSGVMSSVIINGMRSNRRKLREIPPPEP